MQTLKCHEDSKNYGNFYLYVSPAQKVLETTYLNEAVESKSKFLFAVWQTVTTEYFLNVMRHLRDLQKRLNLWKDNLWILYHEKVPSYTLLLALFLRKTQHLYGVCDIFCSPNT